MRRQTLLRVTDAVASQDRFEAIRAVSDQVMMEGRWGKRLEQRSYLSEGEKLAGLEAQKGSLWHAYRRKWATERKHLPDVHVAAAGGWKPVQTLKTAYQQADAETILRVVLEVGELREAK